MPRCCWRLKIVALCELSFRVFETWAEARLALREVHMRRQERHCRNCFDVVQDASSILGEVQLFPTKVCRIFSALCLLLDEPEFEPFEFISLSLSLAECERSLRPKWNLKRIWQIGFLIIV